MKWLILVSVLWLAPWGSAAAAERSVESGGLDDVHEFEDLELVIDLSAMPGFRLRTGDGWGARKSWKGMIGERDAKITLYVIPRERFPRMRNPRSVIDYIEYNRKNQDSMESIERRHVPGNYGYISYAALAIDVRRDGTKPVEHSLVLAGILPEAGYYIQILAKPAMLADDLAAATEFLEGCVKYTGPEQTPEWTDEEIETRWERDAPDSAKEDDELMAFRTKYYLIFTNLKKGTARSFASKMDECFEEIRAVYPFDVVEGERLLPIFYFVKQHQYNDWCVKNLGWTLEQASRSGGVASRDVYATYHQAVKAPVHIHEGTHQIFSNRLFLGGGGSWFQEGVAEYMSTVPNDLGNLKSVVKRRKHVPLEEFVQIESLLMSSEKGSGEAGDNYAQAASVIEFVRHSKWSEGKFDAFLRKMGSLESRPEKASIDKALKSVFTGQGLDRFEEEYVKYWTKRKKPRKR